MENLTVNISDLYEELKENAFNEGAFSAEEWSSLVDSLIEDKRAAAEIDDDINWLGIAEALKSKYDEFQEEVGVM